MAKDFYKQIKKSLPKTSITLKATKYAGHAEELAYLAAKNNPTAFIFSVSGDGGYSEVINGAVKAANDFGSDPICAVLPGGNANDHYNSVTRRPLLEAIKEEGVEKLDLLEVSFNGTTRYAHSYVGLGLTPMVAKELNEHSLNRFQEMWLVFKTYWTYRPFEIVHNGKKTSFDSILMVLIDRMAKVLTLDEGNRPDDGSFQLFHWPHGNKRKLLVTLFKALIGKKIPHQKTRQYTFTTVKPIPIQLDGELLDLPANTKIAVRVAPDKIRMLI